MNRLISLGVQTNGPEDFFRTFQDLAELATNLGVTHDYVSVSSSVLDDDPHEEPAGEDLYYDENTMFVVHQAIKKCGLRDETATHIINDLQNAGVVFRMRLSR